ncbi:hypothetical protein HPB50_015342 [Hyalomma asiaticum]|uniref:Uncharacterized protein n=1 Tax=Hyalomma asiaticum TaxID=266040 RepID=A0ACB7SYB1_HYAAI|nr:hypothetical protein HPB50_015342 [Hyalomma asiaticum]
MTDNGAGDPTSRDEASTIAIDVEQRSRGPRPQSSYIGTPERPLSWVRERPIERRQPPEEARFNTSFFDVPTGYTRCQLTPARPRPAAESYQTPDILSRTTTSRHDALLSSTAALHVRRPRLMQAVIHQYAILAVFKGIFHVSLIADTVDQAFQRTRPA